MLPRVTISKNQKHDFEVARNFLIEMTYYTFQNYLKKMQAC